MHRDQSEGQRSELPRALTFFLNEAERRAALRALKAQDADSRERALLKALGVKSGGD